MNTRDAYNRWAKTYDIVDNKTRDLEKQAIREVLKATNVQHILEIGCGTGKNTTWLARYCEKLTAIDFSPEMLKRARGKINDPKVTFKLANIDQAWESSPADVITCSLVLEHIRDIDFIFEQAAGILNKGGRFYICELHPYKQIQGSRARFEEAGEVLHLEYFIHHISEYMTAALKKGFTCTSLLEWFDHDGPREIPRLVSYLFQKA
jgi:ubiquinone/menaquinone biosynthesis C-methylase UbiE